MTDYPANKIRQHSWRKSQNQNARREFLAIVLTIVLLFFAANGIIKSFSIKKLLGSSKWDSKSSFTAVLGTTPFSVLVYQTDQPRIAIFSFDENKYLETGNGDKPFEKAGELVASGDGERLLRVASLAFRTDIENYIFLEGGANFEKEKALELFKSFASPLTPIKIISGEEQNFMNTNITRYDLFKLWWQVKGLSVEKLNFHDINGFSEEVITGENTKVLGVDEVSFHHQISPYVKNVKATFSDFKVEIVDNSGNTQSASLASDFVDSLGYSISKVSYGNEISPKTTIVAKNDNSDISRSLASVFDCDILGQSQASERVVTIVLGQDFASQYFE